jgi:copper(I)-binding protein
VMLVGLNRELRPGDTVALTLEFERAGSVDVRAQVRAP